MGDFNEDGLLDLNLIRDRMCYENKYFKQTEDDFFEKRTRWVGLCDQCHVHCDHGF